MGKPLEAQEVLKADGREGKHGELKICCPFCNDDKFHCYVNLKKEVYHCFKCEASGPVIGLKTTPSMKTLKEAFEEAQKKVGVDLAKAEKKVIRSLPRCKTLMGFKPIGIDPYYHLAWNYVRTRKLTTDEVQGNQIHFSLDNHGPTSNSIIFPIYKHGEDDLEYYVCRKTDNRKGYAKYINAPWPKKSVLFRPWTYPVPRMQTVPSSIIVVEGIFDAINLQRAVNTFESVGVKLPTVYALLGKKATHEQIARITKPNGSSGSRATPHITILLDPEAFTHAVRLKMEMHSYPDRSALIKIAMLQEGDPGSAPLKDLQDIVRKHMEFAR